ncbi:MAG: hypothetical protein MJB14_22060 [Spirochaetes bacterium]|nr:hypothetical protein [Spirochaetota bacterium]
MISMIKQQANDLPEIKGILFAMGQSVLTSVNLITEAIEMENSESLTMIETLEPELDQLQIELDAACLKEIKKNKNTKKELQYIWGFLRCGIHLERIGDLCSVVARHLKKILSFKEDIYELNEVVFLAKYINELIEKAIMSLVEEKNQLAYEVMDKEKTTRSIRNMIYKTSVELMRNDNGYVPISMSLVFICRNLARIGELSKNLAANTIFLTEGKDVRYSHIIDVL